MMVSANDAAYAIAQDRRRAASTASPPISTRPRKRLGMQDSTFGDPAGLDDETSYKGGPNMSAYDLAIATRNALTVPAIAKWAGAARVRSSPIRRRHAPRSDEPQQHAARRRATPTRARRLQDRIHEPGAAHARRDRDPQRPHAASRSILGARRRAATRRRRALLDAGFAPPADAGAAARRDVCRRSRCRSYASRAADQTALRSPRCGNAAPPRHVDRRRRRRDRHRAGVDSGSVADAARRAAATDRAPTTARRRITAAGCSRCATS